MIPDRVKLLHWRLSGRIVSEPSCRACGYPVRDLPGTICPECGADRGIVGTIAPTPPLPRGVKTSMLVMIWCLIVLAGAWVLNPFLYDLMPRPISYHEDYMLTPHSKLYGPFQVRRIGYGTGWKEIGPWPKEARQAAVFGNGADAFNGKFVTTLDRQPSGYGSFAPTKFEDGGTKYKALGAHAGVFNMKMVPDWLGQMEIDTSRAEVRAEADELATLMLAPKFEPAVYQNLKQFDLTVKSRKEVGPVEGWPAKMLTVWGLIIAIGAVLIVRRQRARAAAIVSSPHFP